MKHAEGGYPSPKPAQRPHRPGWPLRTAAERRRRADLKHRAAGRVRVCLWLPAQRLADLEGLMREWEIDQRALAIDVAIRFLRSRSAELTTLTL